MDFFEALEPLDDPDAPDWPDYSVVLFKDLNYYIVT